MREPRKPRDRSAPRGLRGGAASARGTVVPAASAPTSSGSSGPALPDELVEAGGGSERAPRPAPAPTPRWWVPVMLGLMIAGLLWIVVFYLSGVAQLPVPALGAWNLGVGFALIIAGFAMTTRWR